MPGYPGEEESAGLTWSEGEFDGIAVLCWQLSRRY